MILPQLAYILNAEKKIMTHFEPKLMLLHALIAFLAYTMRRNLLDWCNLVSIKGQLISKAIYGVLAKVLSQ